MIRAAIVGRIKTGGGRNIVVRSKLLIREDLIKRVVEEWGGGNLAKFMYGYSQVHSWKDYTFPQPVIDEILERGPEGVLDKGERVPFINQVELLYAMEKFGVELTEEWKER